MSSPCAVEDLPRKLQRIPGLNDSLLFGCDRIRVLYYAICLYLAVWGIASLRRERVFPQGKLPGYLFFLTFTIWGNLMALVYYSLSVLVAYLPQKRYKRARRIAMHVSGCSYFVIFVFYTSALSFMDVVRIDKIIDQE
jgi:hypothetical protein